MVRSASCGQRSWARVISRERRDRLVESGGVAGTMPMIADASACRRRGVVRVRHNLPMPVMTPFEIVLNEGQRRLLLARARRSSGEHRDVLRARIVLAAAGGAANAGIARELAVGVDTVRKWRRRFSEHGLDGLRDLPRSGRPRAFAAAVVAEVKALACELPAGSDTPLAKWSCSDLATEAVNRGILASVSASTVRRWLASDALKPWQNRSWIFPRDPDFAVKAARIVLAAAGGAANAGIARELAVGVDTVRKWRRRFSEHGLDGLRDLPRSGRPRAFAAAVVAEVKALACELPAGSDTPLAKWSCSDLATEAVNRGILASVSASTVRRWLASDALKPWQNRSWIFPRDPDFAVKA